VIEDYNKGITNPNGVFSGIARHNILLLSCYYKVMVLTRLCILFLSCSAMPYEYVACLYLLIYLLVGNVVGILVVGLGCVFVVYCVYFFEYWIVYIFVCVVHMCVISS
jgi:hypothetical protein